nr:hypothetical protein [Candidatus Sigynarchaeota archaeon]
MDEQIERDENDVACEIVVTGDLLVMKRLHVTAGRCCDGNTDEKITSKYWGD